MVHVSQNVHDGLANGSHRRRTKNPSLLDGCGPYHRPKPLTEVLCQYGGIEVSAWPPLVRIARCGFRYEVWRASVWSLSSSLGSRPCGCLDTPCSISSSR